MDTIRIGLFFCGCGSVISEMLDMDDLSAFMRSYPGVTDVVLQDFFCNKEGLEVLKKTIKEKALTHVLVSACSLRTHLGTFQKCVEEAGLNPYKLTMVNAREQCVWVTPDRQKATSKLKAMLAAGLRRVVAQESLSKREIDTITDVVIIGGGITGIETAIMLAKAGNRKIYLLEKEPSIGGSVVKYDELFPNMECAPCLVAPRLSELSSYPNIEIITNASVTDVLGFWGNFIVKTRVRARYVDPAKCIGCMECFAPCSASMPGKFDNNRSTKKAVNILFPGAVPNCAYIDMQYCLRSKGQDCRLCSSACPFDAFKYNDKDVDREIKAGAIILATGAQAYDISGATRYGYGKVKNVISTMDYERMVSQNGPTGGAVVLEDGSAPKSVAVIHCAGSKTEEHLPYCSGICCMNALKVAKMIKHKVPGVEVLNLYTEMTLPGKHHQKFFDELTKEAYSVRLKKPDAVDIVQGDNCVDITYTGVNGRKTTINADLVILSVGLVPAAGSKELADLMKLGIDADGFYQEESIKIKDTSTTQEGIYIAGCCQYPKDIAGAVDQGLASAARIMSTLIEGKKLETEAMVACINADNCSGCRLCISLCPYKAISYNNDKKVSEVNEVLCHGCGTCVASCPSGAASGRNFTDRQIGEEIRGLLSQ